MIHFAWRALSGEIRTMHAAALLLAGSAALSAVLALVRDRLLAHTFGAGASLDVYYAAFRIPDLIFVLVASLFSAYVLIPELARRDGLDAERRYIDTVVLGFGVCMLVVGTLAYSTAPSLLQMLFPELMQGAQGDMLLALTRLLLLQPLFLGLSNVWAAVTQHRRLYAWYAFAPVVYNLGIVAGIVFFYPLFGMYGLGLGVVGGAVLHMLVQLPAVRRSGFFGHIPTYESYVTVVRTMKISLPRTLALSATHIVVLGMLILAAGLSVGSVAVFSLAFNLQAVPLAIIGASYSVAAFPTLARMFAEGNKEQYVLQVANAARHIIFWSVPALALLVVLRAHIVRTVLGSGNFDWTDTRLTAATLALFACALTAQALTLLLARAYYAAEHSYTPFVISVCAGGISLLSGYGLLKVFTDASVLTFVEELLRVRDVSGVEVLALPLAFSLGAVLGAVFLILRFERDFGGFTEKISRTVWESITAAGVAGASAYAVLWFLGGISAATTLPAVLLHGTASGVVGVLAAGLSYVLTGSVEARELYAALRLGGRKEHTPVQSTEETLA